MMKTALRCAGAFAAGLVVAGVLVVAVEFVGMLAHPLPEDFGETPEEMHRHVELCPAWFLAAAVPMWAAAYTRIGVLPYDCTPLRRTELTIRDYAT